MKRLFAVALLVLGFALPACGQRVSSHGGSSFRSGPSFHGGFSAPASHGFAGGAPRFSASRPAFAAHTPRLGGARSFSPRPTYGLNYGSHSPAAGRHRDHGRYRREYNSTWGYGYGVGPVLGYYPGYPGYPDDFSDDDAQDTGQNYVANGGPDGGDEPGQYAPDGSDGPAAPYPNGYGPAGYGPVTPASGPPAPRMPYRPSAQPPQQDAPQSQEAVTLIFKDGRPAEQIHNYVLTPTTIYAGRRDIALDEIDMAATEKANRDAGVDFQLPNAAN